ncbi:hypothetical protein Q4534_07875 [Cyclobacterium sp. 1_MG-2023]|uniref:hypothetical protein n=1 Tax=Cyclobacterium sp. 1_MG-2023 TaxID=3062681 RepID=UPI0026E45823|nr:hypothetical protein [Cyclobacterium sp. 1_MG-2023]MDO6437318.1 hypothetical protein [Cyclobacterium sp. 1_MG-2023]
MAFINGLKPIPIEQISLIYLMVILNEYENFQHDRSKLHYVKLGPVVTSGTGGCASRSRRGQRGILRKWGRVLQNLPIGVYNLNYPP